MKLVNYDLANQWNSHWIISSLRSEVMKLVEKKATESKIPFDPQDLEHQTLFFLTTYHPAEILQEQIVKAFYEQYLLIKQRLLSFSSQEELSYLFRGLKRFYPDLNSRDRLHLKDFTAMGQGRRFTVSFRVITDKRLINLYTEGLHYIHAGRSNGTAFALFFEGDKYPFAIETAEPSTLAREYKRKALEMNGINPDKAIELTRLYTLPGSPIGTISVLDHCIQKHYLDNTDTEAIFTCTMPSYSKTSGSTTSGGMTQVLLTKAQTHYFVKKVVENNVCWQNTTRRCLANLKKEEIKRTHKQFHLLPTVDVFIPLRPLKPKHKKLQNKVLYYDENDIEQ